jgi:hypothetical protein
MSLFPPLLSPDMAFCVKKYPLFLIFCLCIYKTSQRYVFFGRSNKQNAEKVQGFTKV